MKNGHCNLREKWTIMSASALLFVCSANANPTLPSIPSGTFNITSYGASTGSANNATAIQNAINAASAAGGGTVVVPSGTFLSGPVVMKSKINLNLASGSVLKMLAYGTYPGNTTFISGSSLTNIEISGSGTIEGQGSAWWSAYNANNSVLRPGMIGFQGSSIIEITGVKLQNAPNSHVGMGYNCSEVTIKGVTVSSPGNSPNTDGFDVEGTSFLFDGCNIACGDDNIAIDAGHAACRYFTIQNCTFGTGHGCSMGSYLVYGVDHVTVTNCSFNGTAAGIKIKSNRTRGAVVQYLTYSKITMSNVGVPIGFTCWYPSDPSNPSTVSTAAVTSTTPNYKHILIQNLTATGSSSGGNIYGLPEMHISDLTLDNVKITSTTGMNIYYADSVVFKNGSSITASSGYPVTIYAAGVSGITTHTYP